MRNNKFYDEHFALLMNKLSYIKLINFFLSIVFRGIVKSRTVHGDLMRLEVDIQNTWRITGAAEHLLPKTASPNLPAYRVWLRIKNNSADKRHSRCLCPNLQVGQSYLFITRSHQVL